LAARKTPSKGAKPDKSFVDALRIAVNEPIDPKDKKGRRKLRALADKLVEKALDGDTQAINHIADRLDGKPSQAINVGGQEDNPIESKVTIEFVNVARKD